jgi:3-oxoacyl-(acyl-carrier-protein) synthase
LYPSLHFLVAAGFSLYEKNFIIFSTLQAFSQDQRRIKKFSKKRKGLYAGEGASGKIFCENHIDKIKLDITIIIIWCYLKISLETITQGFFT